MEGEWEGEGGLRCLLAQREVSAIGTTVNKIQIATKNKNMWAKVADRGALYSRATSNVSYLVYVWSINIYTTRSNWRKLHIYK